MSEITRREMFLRRWETIRYCQVIANLLDFPFLAFVWIMGWTTVFWILLVYHIAGIIAGAAVLESLERKMSRGY